MVTRGWNGYRNKSQHRKSTLEKKILPPFQQGFEPATFQSRVRCSNHWAIPAPNPSETEQGPLSASRRVRVGTHTRHPRRSRGRRETHLHRYLSTSMNILHHLHLSQGNYCPPLSEDECDTEWSCRQCTSHWTFGSYEMECCCCSFCCHYV